MVGARTLLLSYRSHLRVQPLRESMAVAGVAAGVALFFAVQIANTSVTGSLDEVVHGIAGRATLEVAARSPEGFDAGIVEQIASMPGVRALAPVLAQQAVVASPTATRALTLVGADERLAGLGGELSMSFQRAAETSRGGLLVLTERTAAAIGARRGAAVSIAVGGRTEQLTLAAVVPASRLGPLADSPIAATPLPVAQSLVGLPRRVTRVLLEPARGQESQVLQALSRRFGETLNVRPVDSEVRLLSGTAKPEAQLTALFSAVSLVVGVILAYNALLLASGGRRAFIACLVQLGAPQAAIVASLLFDVLILGIAGSLLGLLLGDAISLLAYRAPPKYLAAAFPIAGQRIVSPQTILAAFGAGMLAAVAATVFPAVGLLKSVGVEPQPGLRVTPRRAPRSAESILFGCGALLVGCSTAASVLWPAVTVVALATVAAGIVLCLPTATRYALKLARAASRRSSDPSALLASGELASSPARSIALLATGTIAVFVLMMIGGSVADVQRAVRAGAEQTGASADLWIRPGGPENIYATQPFASADMEHRLRRLALVRSVLIYRGSFLDLPGRRIWVIGVPAASSSPIAANQLVQGTLAVADQRLREGGWALVSQTIARERRLRVGQPLSLPTPSGRATLRIAATISNYGWLPGTVILNADDYARLWHTTRASQLAVTLEPGVPISRGRLAAQHVLPRVSALRVQTARERQSAVSAVLGSTLSRLSQTTAAVLAAAIATIVAMVLSSVSQRRGRLDALLSIGMSSRQLARLVLYETGWLLLGGCLIGVASGTMGQYLIDRWTQDGTGSPVRFAVAWQLGLRTVLLAGLTSAAVAVIAALRTVGFQARTSFSTDLAESSVR
jgi:putative ABC transport system permease protein